MSSEGRPIEPVVEDLSRKVNLFGGARAGEDREEWVELLESLRNRASLPCAARPTADMARV